MRISPVPGEVRRCGDEVGEPEVTFKGQRILSPVLVVIFKFRFEADQVQFTGVIRIMFIPAVRLRLLIDNTGGHSPVVVDEPACSDPATRGFNVVEIRLRGAFILKKIEAGGSTLYDVNEPAVFRCEANQAKSPGFTERDVDHAADVVTHVAMLGCADVAINPGIKRGRVRLVGYDAQHTRLGAGAKKRALRPTQGLDAFDIHHPRIGLPRDHQ